MDRKVLNGIILRMMFGHMTAVDDLVPMYEGKDLLEVLKDPSIDISSVQYEAVQDILSYWNAVENDIVQEPKLEKVRSSNIDALGYNPMNNTLYVRFKSNSVYTYQNTTYDEYKALKNAQSIGKAFHVFKESHTKVTKV